MNYSQFLFVVVVVNKGNYCLKIGNAPEYMTFDFDGDGDLDGKWKHQTLEQCCLQYFHSDFDGKSLIFWVPSSAQCLSSH